MSRGPRSRRRARNADNGGIIAAETGDPMTGGKDEYYRPWLDKLDGEASATGKPGDAAAEPVPGASDTRSSPLPAHRAPRPAAASNEAQDDDSASPGATIAAGLKRGWNGFTETTIRWSEQADIPSRVAALEIGDKARRLGATLSRNAGQAGRSVARASVAAGKAGGEMIGKAGAKASSAIGAAATHTRAATRTGIDSSIAATRTQGGKLAAGARDAARPMIDRVAPPKPAAPVVGSALDRLVADEDAADSNQSASSNIGDLPLFGDHPPAAGTVSETPADAPKRDKAAADTPRAAHQPREPKKLAAADPTTSPAPPAATSVDGIEGPPASNGGASGDAAPERRRNIAIALAGIAALIVAVMAGSAFWGRGAPASDASPVAATPNERLAAGLDQDRRAEIEAVVEAYILDHPEIIPQALERLQQRESSAAIARLRPAIERPFAGAWGGNPEGDVVITEYSDFACTFCRRSVPDIERLIKTDPGVKIVYRELPILSAQSGPAAKVALAAARKGRYRDFHLALFALGQPSEANILAAAQKAGMTAEDVAAAKADPALDREIASNVSVAQQLRFEGTPSFVVGDTILHGAVGYDALKAAVAEARKGGPE